MSPPTERSPSVPSEPFLRALAECELLTAAEVHSLRTRLAPALRQDCRPLIQQFVKQQKLTTFQATALVQGKGRELMVDNYVILDKLGEGGMGVVFKARHRRMGQVVALKVLASAMTAEPAAVKRFLREIRAAARLHHPNIVAALDAGECRGTPFLVMEYVEGVDLAKRVRTQGPFQVAQAVDCIRQAALGLAHAHAAGIIHRDIKPSNLLLDARRVVKVLDLGLARRASDDDSATQELTNTGAILGTCDFMAPEQALNSKKAEQRSDIYSLGCTLYFLLAGKAMFGGQTSMEKLLAHRETPIPPLPGAPAPLQALYQKMVAKRVEDRWASMNDAIAALESCRRPGAAPVERVRRRPVRKLAVAAAVLVAALLVVLFFVVSGGPAGMSTRPSHSAALAAPTFQTKGSGGSAPELDVNDPARWRNAVNLMAHIRLPRDIANGAWETNEAGLSSNKVAAAKLVLPYQPPEEYDFRITFTRHEGDHSVMQVLSKGGRCFGWELGIFPNKACGFNTVAGRANNNPTTSPGKDLTNGQRHTSIVQVRNGRVLAYLDGVLIRNYKTDYSDMGEPSPWKWPTPNCLGVGSWLSPTTFHTIEVLELTGKGTITHPADGRGK